MTKPSLLLLDLNLSRAVIALAMQNDLKMHQMDVTTAFLNGELATRRSVHAPT